MRVDQDQIFTNQFSFSKRTESSSFDFLLAALKEGILTGISGGSTFAAACRIAVALPDGGVVLCMLPDPSAQGTDWKQLRSRIHLRWQQVLRNLNYPGRPQPEVGQPQHQEPELVKNGEPGGLLALHFRPR